MTKTITKVGNSQGIMFDAAFMDLARLIVLMPLRKGPPRKEVSATIKKTIKDYRRTLQKLA